ncbi:MAG: hypothetical protein U1E65_06000 [Myxococcota bacterium]
MSSTRRSFLAGGALALGGCVLPARAPVRIDHPRGPLGVIPRPSGTGLLVGAAKIDITPPPGSTVWIAGFGPNRKMAEVLDPLSAVALVIDDGVRRVGLCLVDLIGFMRPSVERVRALVGPSIDLAVASTHNHASPDTVGFWGPAVLYAIPHKSGIDPAYLRVLERRLAQVVARAAKNARPARLRFGQTPLPAEIAMNIRPPFQVEQTLFAIEAQERNSGAPIATFVNFACHPETLGPRSHRLSAGFPGVLRARLDDEIGGVTVFANGSLGGMVVPNIEEDLDADQRRAADVRMGTAAAEATKQALRDAEEIEVQRVRYRRSVLEVPTTNALFRWLELQGIVEPRPRGPRGEGLISEVGRIDLGPASFALVPGEATPFVGGEAEALLRRRGARFPRVIGLANDELGYLLDPAKQFDDPEFNYEVSMSVGREAVPSLLEALGRLD